MDRELAIKNGYGLAIAKAERAEAVSKIVADVNGKVFDGDETSQTRLACAFLASLYKLGVFGDLPDTKVCTWTLADNSALEVDASTLGEALFQSMTKMSELWRKPYED